MAISFKEVLKERKHVEELEDQIEQMTFDMNKQKEIADSEKSSQLLGRRAISSTVLHQSPLAESTPGSASNLAAVRAAAAKQSGRASLPAQMLAADTDEDGLLSLAELARALSAIG